MAKDKRPERTYWYRGEVERGTGRGYRWVAGYSAGDGGSVEYPWMTRAEARAQAKADGVKAVFVFVDGRPL
jgi:hypothetical protein